MEKESLIKESWEDILEWISGRKQCDVGSQKWEEMKTKANLKMTEQMAKVIENLKVSIEKQGIQQAELSKLLNKFTFVTAVATIFMAIATVVMAVSTVLSLFQK